MVSQYQYSTVFWTWPSYPSCAVVCICECFFKYTDHFIELTREPLRHSHVTLLNQSFWVLIAFIESFLLEMDFMWALWGGVIFGYLFIFFFTWTKENAGLRVFNYVKLVFCPKVLLLLFLLEVMLRLEFEISQRLFFAVQPNVSFLCNNIF